MNGTARSQLTSRAQLTSRVAAVLGAGVLGLTAGCTSSTPPPTSTASAPVGTTTTSVAAPGAADILEKAKTNAVKATSAAFTGRIEQDGAEMVIDFKGTSDGSSSDVTLEVESQGRVRVISVAGEVYLQGDAQFWTAQGVSAPADPGAFVRAPAEAKELSQQLSLNAFLDEAFAAVTPAQLSDTVGSETVGGVDAWVITDAGGKDKGALYVSKSDFQIVRFTGSSASPAELDFARWNEDLGIVAPPADQVATAG